MTEFRLPIGTLRRAPTHARELNGTRWYGFKLLGDRENVKYFSEAQLLPLNPVLAELPVYTCEPKPVLHYDVPPNVYPAAVFLGISCGILQRATIAVDVRTAYADSELLVMGEAA